MNEYIAVPNIRFNGFEDKWKINRLLSITTVYSGLTYKPEDTQPFGTLVLRSSNIQEGKIIKKDCVYVNSSVVNSINVEKKDVILVVRNGSKKLIGKHAIVMQNMKDTVIGAFMSGLRPKNGDFLNALLSTETFKKEVFRSLGATINQITNKDLKRMKFYLPFNYEQQKIGDFFTKLDKLLDLQQQKIDKLGLLKKVLLQNLFPKHDTKIPELRFKGFKNEWEKDKLKGYIEKVSGNDGRMNLPTLTISAAKGWMNQNERFSNNIAGKEQKNYTLLKKGELSYNHGNSKLFKYGVVYELINYDEALVPKVYHSFRVNSKASARFIEYLFRGKKVDRELRKLVTSGARMDGLLNINFNNFENIKLYFPEKAEQQKIGNLLSKVDQLIELENKKLENLQQFKKCFLQNMFVE